MTDPVISPRAGALTGAALAAVMLALWLVASCGGQGSSAEITDADSDGAIEAAGLAGDPGDSAVGSALPPQGRPELLSEWGQLTVDSGQLGLADNVVPYTLNSALFSDYAHKLRTIWLPDGAEPAVYQPNEVFDFPVGTVITKTFYYPVDETGPSVSDGQVLKTAQSAHDLGVPLDLASVRLLETRVLTHRDDGWVAFPYVWDAEQTEATLKRTGDLIPLTLVDASDTSDAADPVPFTYVVPDANQCAGCHATNHSTGVIVPIGPKARHLNLDSGRAGGGVNQLINWHELGLVGELPNLTDVPRSAAWDDDSVPVEARARAYLDINCAHCHNSVGPADTSALFLEPSTPIGQHLGVCKPPVAAGTGTGGRLVSIAPGAPDESIFVYRLASTDPASMMPEVGRALAHDEGVDLISAWIEVLSGDC